LKDGSCVGIGGGDTADCCCGGDAATIAGAGADAGVTTMGRNAGTVFCGSPVAGSTAGAATGAAVGSGACSGACRGTVEGGSSTCVCARGAWCGCEAGGRGAGAGAWWTAMPGAVIMPCAASAAGGVLCSPGGVLWRRRVCGGPWEAGAGPDAAAVARGTGRWPWAAVACGTHR
jgi:hypothetical protein